MGNTKSLGLLGLGSQSTLFYIKELNTKYNKKFKGFSTCPFKLLNTNFDEINNLLPHTSEKLDQIIHQAIDGLLALKVDIILVPNITLHETLDNLKLNVPIIHPLKTTLIQLQQNNCKNIVLIASWFSMNSNYIKSYFNQHQIYVNIPSEEDMKFIDKVRKLIYEGSTTSENLMSYNVLIEKYAQNNTVVIACTELSLGIIQQNKLNVYDMSRIQILQAIEEITSS